MHPTESTAPADPAVTAAVRHVMVRLMPFLLVMYVIAFLDRVNLGFAKTAFQTDVGLSDTAYALGAGLFFLGYALFEVPSNLVLQRTGARWWLCRIMVSWGLVSAAMALTTSETVFYVLRFLLGTAEAGFFPGVLLFITHWVPHAHRARCNALLYLGIPLASMLGGPLSGALLELDGAGGLRGWQWMFAVEGLVACVVGVWSPLHLDDKPADAGWLPARQRVALQAQIDREAADKQQHSPTRLRAAMSDRRVLHFCLIYFLMQCGVYGMTFYLPTQIAAVAGGSVGLTVGLVTAIPWTVALLANLAVSARADRMDHRRTRRIAAVAMLFGSAGIAGSALLPGPLPVVTALSVAAAGYVAVQPVFWTFPAAHLTGTAAAAGIALINSLGNLGGFVAPLLKNWIQQTLASPTAGLAALAACGVLAAALFLRVPGTAATAEE